MMVVITQITGPWVRKLGVNTIPDLFGRLFGKKARILIVALIAMFVCLPGNGWNDVAANLDAMGNSWMLDIFGNKDLIIGFAIPTIFTCTMFQGVSQMGLQTCIAAKDVKSVKKSIWLAGPVNGLFCIIPTLLGMAALALGYLEIGGNAMMMTPAMMLAILPKWVVALICASFLGALLSTFAMTSLCPSTIFAYDLYGGLFKPNATEKEKVRVMRIMIVIVGIAAIVLANFQPTVVTTINWIFTWAVPMFICLIFGLCWKRNSKALIVTCIISWIANVVWITFNAIPGSKPGYFRLSKEEKAATAEMKATHEA